MRKSKQFSPLVKLLFINAAEQKVSFASAVKVLNQKNLDFPVVDAQKYWTQLLKGQYDKQEIQVQAATELANLQSLLTYQW